MCLDYDKSPVFNSIDPYVDYEIGLQSQIKFVEN